MAISGWGAHRCVSGLTWVSLTHKLALVGGTRAHVGRLYSCASSPEERIVGVRDDPDHNVSHVADLAPGECTSCHLGHDPIYLKVEIG